MKRAYVTVLSDDGDAPGVEALGASLRASGAREPAVVMAGRDVSPEVRARLSAQGFRIRDVEPVGGGSEGASGRRGLWKLRAWELVELEKVVFLSADSLVLRNVDELFERPELSAAPDLLIPERFDAGVMVLAPSEETFRRLAVVAAAAARAGGGDGEQGVLNEVFAWWRGAAGHRLSMEYNMCNLVYPFLLGEPGARGAAGRGARILRYSMQRPWEMGPRLTGASSLWWDAYFEARPEMDRAFRRRIHAAADRLFERVASALFVEVARAREGVRRSVA